MRKNAYNSEQGQQLRANASNAANRAGAMAQQGAQQAGAMAQQGAQQAGAMGQQVATGAQNACNSEQGQQLRANASTLLTELVLWRSKAHNKPGQWRSKVHNRPRAMGQQVATGAQNAYNSEQGQQLRANASNAANRAGATGARLAQQGGRIAVAGAHQVGVGVNNAISSDEAKRLKAIAIAGGAEAQELAAKGLAALKQVPVHRSISMLMRQRKHLRRGVPW